jgi:hypothetical protein
MTEKCDCEACTVREKYQDKQKIIKNTDKISGFKENIAQTSNISSKVLSKLTKSDEKPKNNKFFRITISEFDEIAKTCMEYSCEVDEFDFTMLLDEFFDLDFNNDNDVDDLNYENDVVVFKSLDEVIDYLKENKEEDN